MPSNFWVCIHIRIYNYACFIKDLYCFILELPIEILDGNYLITLLNMTPIGVI